MNQPVTTASPQPTVDVNVPRFNQAVISLVTAVAFVLQQPWLVIVAFALLALSWAAGPTLAPLTQLYVRLIRPRVQPEGSIEFEKAAPPRFAQLIGTVFLTGSSVALLSGWATLGWALSLVVTVLAALAATTRICVGCIVYERVVSR